MNYRLVMTVLSLQMVVVMFVFVVGLRWISYYRAPAESTQTWEEIAYATAAVVAIVALLQSTIWGLHVRKRWAWYAALVSCVVCLAAPWTLFQGIVGLCGLLGRETRLEFGLAKHAN